jgi:hypothetical protein
MKGLLIGVSVWWIQFEYTQQKRNMFPFESPSTFSISGTTMCGKTTWLFKLLLNSKVMFNNAPHKILYCYGVWQDLFNEMEQKLANIHFHEGLPKVEQIDSFVTDEHNIIILDDLMNECVKSSEVEVLFSRGAHHKNLTIIYLNQNIFCQGKNARNIALNCHYIVLFQNLRDGMQIQRLGQQIFPGQGHVLVESYKNCVENPYGYLVIDLSPHTDHKFRLRTDIFPNEDTKIFCPRGGVY